MRVINIRMSPTAFDGLRDEESSELACVKFTE